MRWPTGLRALNHRDFRLFWSGQLVSLVGRWMQAVALSWLVLELTDSPLRLGIVNSLQFAPLLLLSFPAGVLADRLAKRRLLVLTQAGLMAAAFALAALSWSGRVRYWQVVALAAAIGVANALDMPTRQSFVIEMVGRDDLLNAVALNSAVFNAARIVGPAVGGVLIARYGTAIAFLLNAVTYVPVILALLGMEAGSAPGAASRSLRAEIAEGVRYAAGSPLTSLVLSLVLAVSVFVINHNVLVPLLAREVLGAEVRGFGFLMAAVGVGALAAAVGVAQFGRPRPPLRLLVTAAAVAAGGVLALAGVREFWLAAALLFVAGAGQIVFLASCSTTLQITTPDTLRGRVMSLYTLVFAGISPVGALVVGAVAEAFGTPAACAAGGGLGLAAVLALAFHWQRRHALAW